MEQEIRVQFAPRSLDSALKSNSVVIPEIFWLPRVSSYPELVRRVRRWII